MIDSKVFTSIRIGTQVRKKHKKVNDMTLKDAVEGKEYIIKSIEADDEEMKSFLFSLGCYAGEPITVVTHLKAGPVVSIKDGRYNFDSDLAATIQI